MQSTEITECCYSAHCWQPLVVCQVGSKLYQVHGCSWVTQDKSTNILTVLLLNMWQTVNAFQLHSHGLWLKSVACPISNYMTTIKKWALCQQCLLNVGNFIFVALGWTEKAKTLACFIYPQSQSKILNYLFSADVTIFWDHLYLVQDLHPPMFGWMASSTHKYISDIYLWRTHTHTDSFR